MSQLLSEIEEQPKTLARLLELGRSAAMEAARRIRAFQPSWVVIAARGTSDNAARYAQYLFGAHNRLGVGLAAPSLCTLYDAPPDMRRALTIGISQSGQSPDIVSWVEEARRQGGATLAITNDPSSPLALSADSCIPLSVGEEKAVAATKTYTGELLALGMLSAALSGKQSNWEALETVPGAVRTAISKNQQIESLAQEFAGSSQFLVLGRGFNYCTAFEVALKIKETSYIVAEPYSVADLLHGPVAMVDEGFPCLVIAPSGQALAGASELVELLRQRKAHVVVLSDDTELCRRGQASLKLPRGVAEWASPIVSVVPGQQFAHALAVAKGLDPDTPRGLSKVTRTR
ncbi:MAG: SIS domain-containing protein [Polyangiaceae bacterium]|nr:SIS domain-containing protein [Polyangiaceae bacterium]MCB9608212.1 SIS domain-containing protein [Polyangiaceae bacterium]